MNFLNRFGCGATKVLTVCGAAFAQTTVCRASPIEQVEQDNIRLVSCPIEDDFTTVRGYVEVTDGKLATKVRQLPLASGPEIHNPALLMRNVSPHAYHRIIPTYKSQTP